MNTDKTEKGKNHITLKEAAELSGYAPDYIGQLIRQGKLPGEQVYSSVAWVTTEEAVLAYLEEAQARKENKVRRDGYLERASLWARRTMTSHRLARAGLWGIIGIVSCLALFLFFIFSVSLDKTLERNAVQRVKEVRQQP